MRRLLARRAGAGRGSMLRGQARRRVRAIWSSRAAPTLPGPITPSEMVCGDSQNPACAARSRLGGVAGGDGHRDVAFRRALRDGAHVDARASQGANKRAATPGVPAMPSPTAASTLMRVPRCTSWIWPGRSRARRRREQCGASGFGLAAAHHAADRMLGRALRNHHHRQWRHASAPNTRSAVPGTPIMPRLPRSAGPGRKPA
jgi:hypothetical protein